MRLIHQPLQVVDETFPAVLGVLIVATHVNRLLRTHLLAESAEDAAKFVDLEHEWIAVPLLVLARNELDAVRGTDGRAKSAGDAAKRCLTVRAIPLSAARM
jgi:hypothetical protein